MKPVMLTLPPHPFDMGRTDDAKVSIVVDYKKQENVSYLQIKSLVCNGIKIKVDKKDTSSGIRITIPRYNEKAACVFMLMYYADGKTYKRPVAMLDTVTIKQVKVFQRMPEIGQEFTQDIGFRCMGCDTTNIKITVNEKPMEIPTYYGNKKAKKSAYGRSRPEAYVPIHKNQYGSRIRQTTPEGEAFRKQKYLVNASVVNLREHYNRRSARRFVSGDIRIHLAEFQEQHQAVYQAKFSLGNGAVVTKTVMVILPYDINKNYRVNNIQEENFNLVDSAEYASSEQSDGYANSEDSPFQADRRRNNMNAQNTKETNKKAAPISKNEQQKGKGNPTNKNARKNNPSTNGKAGIKSRKNNQPNPALKDRKGSKSNKNGDKVKSKSNPQNEKVSKEGGNGIGKDKKAEVHQDTVTVKPGKSN